jgi:hypothetical protein
MAIYLFQGFIVDLYYAEFYQVWIRKSLPALVVLDYAVSDHAVTEL